MSVLGKRKSINISSDPLTNVLKLGIDIGGFLDVRSRVILQTTSKANKMLKKLVSDNDRKTAWAVSLFGFNENLLNEMIAIKSDVNIKDNKGWTALSWSINEELGWAANALIHNDGVNPDIQTKYGLTALMLAVGKRSEFKGNPDIAMALIARSTNLDIQAKHGYTALMFAVIHKHVDIVKALIDKGANLDLQNNRGRTALEYSLRKTRGKSTEIAKALIAGGANLDIQTMRGDTFLMYALRKQNTETAKTLIAKGVNLDFQNKDGDTALMIAARMGHTNIVKALIAKGANLDLQDNRGYTALIIAASLGKEDIVCALVDKGANLELRTKHGPRVRKIQYDSGDDHESDDELCNMQMSN